MKSYTDRVHQLSCQSVKKHFDAYADVEWDHADFAIDPRDPRWELTPTDPLGGTGWYATRPQAVRAQLGLHMTAQQMKVGVAFENILSRGLLELASELPDGSAEFRYAYHEVIEEGQHSLMFQEFVNRAGLPVEGITGFEKFMSRFVPSLGRRFPEMFFLFVLGGEEPIDCSQRMRLNNELPPHPLLERIMRIHVTEEARHVCFAKAYLTEHVPKLSAARMWQLRLRIPFTFAVMSKQMLVPPRAIVEAYDIPVDVVREAYADNPAHRWMVLDGLKQIRELCTKLEIVTPALRPLWRLLGIWPGEERPALCSPTPAATED